jgi:predicted Fe-S protein YdhL (DUF1289 family)
MTGKTAMTARVGTNVPAASPARIEAGASVLAERAAVAQRMPRDVPSPCVSVCRMEAASGLCTGCLRTLEEIAGWSGLEDACKRRVWRSIELRTRRSPLPTADVAGAGGTRSESP